MFVTARCPGTSSIVVAGGGSGAGRGETWPEVDPDDEDELCICIAAAGADAMINRAVRHSNRPRITPPMLQFDVAAYRRVARLSMSAGGLSRRSRRCPSRPEIGPGRRH